MKIIDAFHSRLSPFATWWPIPLRLIVGYGFMEHGYAKLARGADSFVLILQALHMPLAPLLAWATILTESIGGFAILIGAFVPLASVPMAIVLLVAIVTVHLPNGFSSIKLQAVTSAVPISVSRVTKRTCFIWRVWRRWYLAELGRFQSIRFLCAVAKPRFTRASPVATMISSLGRGDQPSTSRAFSFEARRRMPSCGTI
jgi:uncharacterized membrane protein YphA (DoxX/SURF4 family)